MRPMILALWLFALPAHAQNVAAGHAALARDDETCAMAIWRPLAEAGDAEAQFEVGNLLPWGRHDRRDPEAGFLGYRRAAEQGHAEAAFETGMSIHYLGLGDWEFDSAEEWFLAAADGGVARALVQLGLMARWGEGRSVDLETALMWQILSPPTALSPFLSADGMRPLMTDAQIANAERRAAACAGPPYRACLTPD